MPRIAFRRAGATLLAMFWVATASATTLAPIGDEELVGRSRFIVNGRVLQTATVEVGTDRRWIMTRVTLRVLENLKNPANPFEGPQTVTFLVPGGERNGRVAHVEGMAPFTVGQEVMVFLRPNPATRDNELVGLSQGRFDVLRDREGQRQLAVRDLAGMNFYRPGSGVETGTPTIFAPARDSTARLSQVEAGEMRFSDSAEFFDFARFQARIRQLIASQP